jgi:hypothetical protein
VEEMTEPTYACSLSDEELTARREEWEGLDERTLLRSEPRPDGRLLVYRGGEETAAALGALIEAERACCPFLEFTLDRGEDEVRVTVRVAPDARAAAVELGILGTD